MSDDTMSTAASSPALSAQQTPAAGPRHDFASDKELMLAAIARMEAAVSGERAAHERLRADLSGMMEAIAHVKTSIRNAQTTGKQVNVLVLLTWLEARVNGIRGYLDITEEPAAPAAAAVPAAAETGQSDGTKASAAVEAVPTVSDVVSRLGRVSDVLEKEAHALEQSVPAETDDVPTVSMLGAMVEALTAPETIAAEPKAEPETAAPAEEPAAAQQAQAEAVIAETAAVSETAGSETVADDPAPEVAEFAEELGAAEPAAIEAEGIAANEIAVVQPEALIAEAVNADEPAVGIAATDTIVETDPSTEAALSVTDPATAEAIALAEPAAPEPEAAAQEATAKEATDAAPTETVEAETVAVAETIAAETAAREPSAHEFELLTRFAAMEAIPFMRDEVGTAVIFEQKTEFDPAAEQMAFETTAKPVETAAQPEAVAQEPQPEAFSAVEPETAESAAVESEPAASIETHIEAGSQAEPEMAVSTQEPAMVAAPGPHPVYAGVSSLSVPIGAISAIAALADATKIETATVAPVEAGAPETAAAEISRVEHFDIDEPEVKAEAATAASGVIAESAVDVIVAEPAPVESSKPIVAESAETAALEATAIVTPRSGASAPEVSAPAVETVSAAVETIAAIEAVEPEAQAEITEIAQVRREIAVVETAKTAVKTETASTEAEATIAGPSEAERAAFAQALAEMERAMAAALEPETASTVEAHGGPAAAPVEVEVEVEVEAVATNATPAKMAETADDDLSDLFEPEPDAALDPNNLLLGPAPAPAFTLDPATAAVLPMHDMALPEAAKTISPQTRLPEAAKLEIVKTSATARPHDPLAPLKAMSDEEKIALFS